jgi:hypothetical protein
MQVWLADDVPCSTGTWLAQKDGTDRLAAQVRMNTLVRLTEQTMMAALTAASDDMPPADPAMVVYHMTPSGRRFWLIACGSAGCLNIPP